MIFGAVPLTPLASVWPIPAIFGFATILLGALAGVLVGYVVGEGRAFRLRVQAQTALFQVDIERRLESALMVQSRLIAVALVPPVPVAAPVAAVPASPLWLLRPWLLRRGSSARAPAPQLPRTAGSRSGRARAHADAASARAARGASAPRRPRLRSRPRLSRTRRPRRRSLPASAR